MSPSWRDRVEVFVGAGALRLAVQPRGWGTRSMERHVLDVPENAEPEALGHELATALSACARRGFDAHIVLSNHHVRYAVVADAGLLAGSVERDAAARHALRSVYGEAAEGWHIVMDEGNTGVALVAGVPQALLASLRNACTAAGAGRVRIEPLFARAVNDILREIGKETGWVGVLEGGRLVLASLDGEGIRSVRTQRILRAPGEEVAAIVQRARLLDGDSVRSTLLLASEEETQVVFAPEAGLQVHSVPLACTLAGEAA